jgi:hypothetical protein
MSPQFEEGCRDKVPEKISLGETAQPLDAHDVSERPQALSGVWPSIARIRCERTLEAGLDQRANGR